MASYNNRNKNTNSHYGQVHIRPRTPELQNSTLNQPVFIRRDAISTGTPSYSQTQNQHQQQQQRPSQQTGGFSNPLYSQAPQRQVSGNYAAASRSYPIIPRDTNVISYARMGEQDRYLQPGQQPYYPQR